MALDIEKHAPLSLIFHPNHLIYALGGSWIYRSAMALGIKTRALFLMQTANAIVGGLCVPLMYRMLRGCSATASSSLAGALIFGFSATWWKFATDTDSYVPSIFFLLCAYILLGNPRRTILAGLAHAAAMLFHELAILFLPVAWIVLRKNRKWIAAYTATALTPVAAAYLIACRVVLGGITIPRLLSWATSHSPDSGFYFNPFRDAALTIRGMLRLLFGGRLDDFTGDLFSKLALAGFFAAAAIFLFAMRGGAKAEKRSAPALSLIGWAAVYTAFLFFWMPQNTFYRLFYLPPLIAVAIAAWRPALALRFVPVILLWNFVFVIYPQSRPERNAPLQFAIAQHGRWTPGTPIVFRRFGPDLWTISYFSPGTAWIGLDHADISELDRDLDYAHSQQKPLWLEADAYRTIESNPEGRRWLSAHNRPAELLEFKDQKYDFRFYCTR